MWSLVSFSFNIMLLHPVASVITSLIFMAQWYSIVYRYSSLAIHTFFDVWVVLTFGLLWIMLLWTCVYKCLFVSMYFCVHVFSSLGCISERQWFGLVPNSCLILVIPWTVAHQAPISQARIVKWVAISFTRIKPGPPALQVDSFTH